jgi:hypothetical protein
MMSIWKHARVLVAALAIGAAVLSLGTGQAEAKPKTNHPPDNGVRCWTKDQNGYLEAYMPGEVVTDADGDKWVCGSNGDWTMVRTDDSGGRTGSGAGHLGTYGQP